MYSHDIKYEAMTYVLIVIVVAFVIVVIVIAIVFVLPHHYNHYRVDHRCTCVLVSTAVL